MPLPQPNADFNSLALALSKDLPHDNKAPVSGPALRKWQQKQRARLREVVKAKDYAVRQASVAAREERAGLRATDWRLRIADTWTLAATELVSGQPQGVTLVIADGGRRSATNQVARLLAAGQRVVVLDPFGARPSAPAGREHLWALLLSAVGDRPLGLQASQMAAMARWLRAERPGEPVTLCALGPRSSALALVTGALEEQTIARLDLHDCFPSLKAVIEQNRTFEQMPELFCFGLLEAFDVEELSALGPGPGVELK